MDGVLEFIGFIIAAVVTIIVALFILYVMGVGFGIVVWCLKHTINLLGIW